MRVQHVLRSHPLIGDSGFETPCLTYVLLSSLIKLPLACISVLSLSLFRCSEPTPYRDLNLTPSL